jgi:hypothetical protein
VASAWSRADSERQSGVGECSAAATGRGENELLQRTDNERRRCMGQRLHALCVEVRRQVARIRTVAGAVRT